MRRVQKRELLKQQVRELDIFPKVEPEIQLQSSSGALVTILTLSAILILVLSEFYYYKTVDVVYEYRVDLDMRRDLNLTLDITINMQCQYLGADYIDVSGNSVDATKWLKLDPTHFELAPNQLAFIERSKIEQSGDGDHEGLDSLARFLHGTLREPLPYPSFGEDAVPDACRIHGVMPVNKISGNFHITAGKSVHHGGGHSHMSGLVPLDRVNFSHRIDRFSFAEQNIGVHTLDGELKISEKKNEMFQYFIKIVPSTTQRLDEKEPFRANQYSVTERVRLVEPGAAIPGVYAKFDLEPLSVHVREKRRSFFQFFIRLCGIVGGIFATSGMLHQFVGSAVATMNKDADAPLPSSSPHK